MLEYPGEYIDEYDADNPDDYFGFLYNFGNYSALGNESYYDGGTYNHVYHDVAQRLQIWFWPWLLVMGMVCNILSGLVMSRLVQRALSTCAYLTIISALDVLMLLVRCGNALWYQFYTMNPAYLLMLHSQSSCKVYPFVFSLLFQLLRWLTVAVAVEGLIATRFSRCIPHMFTLSRTKSVFLLLSVLLICINVHYFWTYELTQLKDNGEISMMCTIHRFGRHYSEEFETKILPILDLLLSDFIPLAVVACCAVGMTAQLCRSSNHVDRLHKEWCARYLIDPAAIQELKVTLLVLCWAFVFCTLPMLCFTIFMYCAEGLRILTQPHETEHLIRTTCSTCEFIFLSCKFFIYLTTSSRFRTELCHLFKKTPRADVPPYKLPVKRTVPQKIVQQPKYSVVHVA